MDRPPSQRARSLAVLLPVLGLFLLLPPFVTLFVGPLRVFGIPLIVLYLFGVWTALVIGAALLARRLQPSTPAEELPRPPTAGVSAGSPAIPPTAG